MKTHFSATQKAKGSANPSGFALVATLMLMLLLGILAVGMLSLSSISLRSSSQNSSMAEARSNARMALMLAIGELQKQMGPDQRISADGAILDPVSPVTNPHWTGVWNSWKASSDAVGTDNPGGPSAHQTIQGVSDTGMAPTYLTNRSDYFRGWLLSLNPGEISNVRSPIDLNLNGAPNPTSTDTAIRLVGDGSLGLSALAKDYVSARLLSVTDPKNPGKTTGRYGWWIGDESQKARIMADSYITNVTPSTPLTSADKIFRAQAPGSMGTTTISGLEGLTNEQQLDGLATLETLDLVNANRAANDPKKPADSYHAVTPFSYSVLADVREGGLKRDLSNILEQPIRLQDNGQEFMLYEFDDPRFPFQNNANDQRRANSRVPIQDLSAYYQLYDNEATFANGRRGGVQYSSSALPSSLQISVPDYDGDNKNQQRLIREYTSLYRRPVVTKVQFLVGVTATPITQGERDWVKYIVDNQPWPNPSSYSGIGHVWLNNMDYIRASDTHKLKLGIQPLVTLWNPNNIPLVMGDSQILRYGTPPVAIRIRKYRAGGETFEYRWMNLGYANDTGGGTSAGQSGGNLLSLRLAKNPVTFEPGEVKVFTIPSTTAANLMNDGNTLNLGDNILDVVNDWDPFGVFLMNNSAPVDHNNTDSPEVYPFALDNKKRQTVVFNPDDKFTISIDTESAATSTAYDDGRNGSRSAEITGSAFSLYVFDEDYIKGHFSTWADALRHDILISRHATKLDNNAERQSLGAFYGELMLPGFPGGKAPIEFDDKANAISGTQIASAADAGEIIALMDFSLSIGCETSSAASGGYGGGRRITSRPFLHSANPSLPFMSEADKASLYDYGLDWQVSKINAVEDSILQAEPTTGNGYYGGGYTVEGGTTHVIQNEIPVLPPISIASLSHAYLGGYSMAKAVPVGEDPDITPYLYWSKSGPVKEPTGVTFQRVTASGQNGLAPHIGQAIGSSYAHPNIPADKAFIVKRRTFNIDQGSFNIPYVDHSYLANKALWDEFFFSSIAPKPSKVPLFGVPPAVWTGRTAKEVADAFFRFNGTTPSTPLPNRRIKPYKTNLDQAKLDTLFTEASLFSNGLADKIAANLMVEGAFNINSTSVDAWKIFLSSLKGKPVAYLNGGTTPLEAATSGTTVSPGILPNAAPIKSADISGPNAPANQWKAGRELTDDEIGQLAEAMVKQVKLRGPFLSLSDFVNRRLDNAKPELALKGALQAALDDNSVSINASFRTPSRLLDGETSSITGFEFPAAATGPIAYGSAPYVDQADVLRHLSEQLTPRGDTFVIRTYGDSIDANGNVVARAWCEAVVQRVPDYVDITDANQAKSAMLTSAANKQYGRKFEIVSFRWLNSKEV